MIVSLTLNPAVDRTLFLPRLVLGEVNRVAHSQLDPGGKGINVSRVAHRLGRATVALGFLAGHVGAIAERALDDEGVAHRFVWVPGETRLNVILVDEATGRSTNCYDRGPAVDATQLETLLGDLRRWLEACRVLVVAGSLPPGVPVDTYAGIMADAARCGVTTILDCDGEALRLGLAGRPWLIKPNVAEASELLGRPLPDLAAVVAAARELRQRGPEAVIISMGAAGSVCATGERVLHVRPPAVERRSTVGSGDSLVAGIAVALAAKQSLEDGLRTGTAAGAATATTPGTHLGSAEEIARFRDAVVIEPLA